MVLLLFCIVAPKLLAVGQIVHLKEKKTCLYCRCISSAQQHYDCLMTCTKSSPKINLGRKRVSCEKCPKGKCKIKKDITRTTMRYNSSIRAFSCLLPAVKYGVWAPKRPLFPPVVAATYISRARSHITSAWATVAVDSVLLLYFYCCCKSSTRPDDLQSSSSRQQ